CPLRPFGGARGAVLRAAVLRRPHSDLHPRRPHPLRLAASVPVGRTCRHLRPPRLPAPTLGSGSHRHPLAAVHPVARATSRLRSAADDRLAPTIRAVSHPPVRRTSWPRSGSSSGLRLRLPPVGQIVVRSGVSSSCTGQNTRSSPIFEFTGLSTEIVGNPQKYFVHPPLTHRLLTERPAFARRARPPWLTLAGWTGTMANVSGTSHVAIILIP
ncbi:MAG: hypothetical protein JWL72_4572, partial [Ilumatobacteraceae bacterium]|nr:hypothetical protein [Ilumatobacteraceae bacterium]